MDADNERPLIENSSDQVSSSNEAINAEESDVELASVKKEHSSDDAGEGGSSDVEKVEVEQDDTIDSMGSTIAAPGGSSLELKVRGNCEYRVF